MAISDDGVVRKFSARYPRTPTQDVRSEQYHNARHLVSNVRCSLYKTDTSVDTVPPAVELLELSHSNSTSRGARTSTSKSINVPAATKSPTPSHPMTEKCKSGIHANYQQHCAKFSSGERSPIPLRTTTLNSVYNDTVFNLFSSNIFVLGDHRPRELCAYTELSAMPLCTPLRVRIPRAASGWHSLLVDRELAVRDAQPHRVSMDTASASTQVRTVRLCALPMHMQLAISAILPAWRINDAHFTNMASASGPFVTDGDKTPTHMPLNSIFPVLKPVLSTASASESPSAYSVPIGSAGATRQCSPVSAFVPRSPLIASVAAAAAYSTTELSACTMSSCSAFVSPNRAASRPQLMSPRKLELRLKSPLKSAAAETCPPTQPLPLALTFPEVAESALTNEEASSNSSMNPVNLLVRLFYSMYICIYSNLILEMYSTVLSTVYVVYSYSRIRN